MRGRIAPRGRRAAGSIDHLAGARYAALGVLNDEHDGLERFLTLGIDKERHAQIGDLPRGHGVLGVLISDPRPLRLADVGMHPRSYGFPAGHPPMTTFLGVPIRIRESVYGNLYLTDKVDGEFTEADEAALVVLAEWAGFAIENARLYRDATQRRDDLQHAVAAFEAALTVARGGRYLHPELGARLVQADLHDRELAESDPLSEREREVLRLLAQGHTNQEIASTLYLSVRTAETHRAHIMQKLRLRTRSELVRYAIDRGMMERR
jgi:DNA-binding CsgD family transcriptional regulator